MGDVTTLPRGQAYTRADLETMPDDGHRYEIVDGTLVVTPAPSLRHQIAVVNLVLVLSAACTDGLRVLTAPFDVALATDTVMQPDVVVARRGRSRSPSPGPSCWPEPPQPRRRSPLARWIGRWIAASSAARVPMIRTCSFARVTAV